MPNRAKLALKILASFVLLLAIAIGLLWIRFRPDAQGRIIPPFESIDMAAYQPFAAAVGSNTGIQIFKGMPHQVWDSERLASELETKQNFKSHGYYFYGSQIAPSADDASALGVLATTPTTFFEWGGTKLCGGYHPDWMIRWTASDGTEHELHLCFGCHEAKLYGPDYQLYCELGEDGFNNLKAILDRYINQPVP
jgi:hypothetical protein